jgi:tagaturonate reductase
VERRQVITAISRGLNPYADWPAFLACARNPELRFLVSNTTEAGIAYTPEPRPERISPATFPAKVTALLSERYRAFAGEAEAGLVVLPCELIDRNGDTLKRTVLQHAAAWGLEPGFAAWVEDANHFLNTLVDRIVPGYPRDESARLAAELGYEDRLLVAGELFHLWVIEGDNRLAEELPFHRAGLDVIWTDRLTPYRDRKVRILNGAHTMMALAGYLAGKDTVRELVEDPVGEAFLRRGLFDEIVPVVPLPEAKTRPFAEAVLERFANPYIRHELLSISLNSVSKFRVRVLPSLLDFQQRFGAWPPCLTFSLAALIAFYRGAEIRDGALVGLREGAAYPIRDDAPVLTAFAEAWSAFRRRPDPQALVRSLLGRRELWDQDLTARPGLADAVARHLGRVLEVGVRAAMQEL